MTVKILISDEDGQVLAGTVTFEDGELRFSSSEGNEQVMKNLVEFECFDVERGYQQVTAQKNPERWIELLPKNLTGSYMRAVIVEWTILRDKKSVGEIDLKKQEIETDDEILDSLFYQLADEGVPIEIKPGVVRYEEMTEKNLITFLKEQGYEVKST